MNETDLPIIHISGTVSKEEYAASMRAMGRRTFPIVLVVSLGEFALLYSLMMLFSWFADGRSEYITLGDWLAWSWLSLLSGPWIVCLLSLLYGFYALRTFLIRPRRAVKQMRELFPDGAPVTYDFFEDHIEWTVRSQKSDEKIWIKYSDLRRKIIETKYHFVVSTGMKNRFNIYKTIMTPEEVDQVRTLLKARSVQKQTSEPL